MSAGIAKSYETYTMTEGDITNQAYGKVGTHESTTYYMIQNFNIRSTSSTALAKGLSIDSVSVSDANAAMSQALRVAAKVYIWFEGEDTELYSDNFTAENLTVTVQFSATTAAEQA